MPYNSSNGIFTNVAGAVTATAGQTIASATWDNIHSDYGTAFTALGPANLPYINGAQNGYYYAKVQTVNFAASAGDAATFAISSILPPNITTYAVEGLWIGNAQGFTGAATVSLYTGAGATGTAVITSTATTVTTSVPGISGGMQVMIPTLSHSAMWNSAQLFLHITTSVTTAGTANVSLNIRPVY
jgi:hypothetical protein